MEGQHQEQIFVAVEELLAVAAVLFAVAVEEVVVLSVAVAEEVAVPFVVVEEVVAVVLSVVVGEVVGVAQTK